MSGFNSLFLVCVCVSVCLCAVQQEALCVLLQTYYQALTVETLDRHDPLLDMRVVLPIDAGMLDAQVQQKTLEVLVALDGSINLQSINADRKAQGISDMVLVPVTTGVASDSVAASAMPGSDGVPFTVFEHVVLGGTFDHLHPGHKIMLTVAALSASKSLVIGLSGTFQYVGLICSRDILCNTHMYMYVVWRYLYTHTHTHTYIHTHIHTHSHTHAHMCVRFAAADELLAKKKYKEALQSFADRLRVLTDFIRSISPALQLDVEVRWESA